MQEFELYTKTTQDSVHVIEGLTHITIFIHKDFMSTGESYQLDKNHFNKLQAYKSVSALVKYAKANQIQPQAVTSCPVPAKLQGKTSPRSVDDVFTVNANANASASDTGRGIFTSSPTADDVPPCFIDDLLAFEPLGFYDLDNNNDNDDSFSSPDFYPCRSCSVDTHYSYLDSNEGLCNACYDEDY